MISRSLAPVRSVIATIIAMAVMSLAPSLHAAATDSSFKYTALSSQFLIAPGANIDVPVYLIETVPVGGSSVLVKDGGLYSGAFSVSTTANSNFSTIGTISFNSAASPNGFSGGNVTAMIAADQRSGTLDENVGNSAIGVAATGGGGTYQILLGTLRFTSPASGSATTFVIHGINDTLTNTGEGLDANGPNYSAATGSSFTIATPEPVSITLLSCGGAGILLRRRRR